MEGKFAGLGSKSGRNNQIGAVRAQNSFGKAIDKLHERAEAPEMQDNRYRQWTRAMQLQWKLACDYTNSTLAVGLDLRTGPRDDKKQAFIDAVHACLSDMELRRHCGTDVLHPYSRMAGAKDVHEIQNGSIPSITWKLPQLKATEPFNTWNDEDIAKLQKDSSCSMLSSLGQRLIQTGGNPVDALRPFMVDFIGCLDQLEQNVLNDSLRLDIEAVYRISFSQPGASGLLTDELQRVDASWPGTFARTFKDLPMGVDLIQAAMAIDADRAAQVTQANLIQNVITNCDFLETGVKELDVTKDAVTSQVTTNIKAAAEHLDALENIREAEGEMAGMTQRYQQALRGLCVEYSRQGHSLVQKRVQTILNPSEDATSEELTAQAKALGAQMEQFEKNFDKVFTEQVNDHLVPREGEPAPVLDQKSQSKLYVLLRNILITLEEAAAESQAEMANFLDLSDAHLTAGLSILLQDPNSTFAKLLDQWTNLSSLCGNGLETVISSFASECSRIFTYFTEDVQTFLHTQLADANTQFENSLVVQEWSTVTDTPEGGFVHHVNVINAVNHVRDPAVLKTYQIISSMLGDSDASHVAAIKAAESDLKTALCQAKCDAYNLNATTWAPDLTADEKVFGKKVKSFYKPLVNAQQAVSRFHGDVLAHLGDRMEDASQIVQRSKVAAIKCCEAVVQTANVKAARPCLDAMNNAVPPAWQQELSSGHEKLIADNYLNKDVEKLTKQCDHLSLNHEDMAALVTLLVKFELPDNLNNINTAFGRIEPKIKV